MRKQFTVFLLVAAVATAALAGAEGKPEPGFGEISWRVTEPRTTAQHRRVVATLGLTDGQKKRVEARYQKFLDDQKAGMMPFWKTPWSQISAEDRQKLHLLGRKQYEEFQADLKDLVGATKFGQYMKRYQVEQLAFGHKTSMQALKKQYAARDARHEKVVKELKLDADRKKAVDALEKKYRDARGKLYKQSASLVPTEENREKLREIGRQGGELERAHLKALTQAMGDAKYKTYSDRMRQLEEAERAKVRAGT